MLCNPTLSFIAIALAYFIVAIAGFNNLPGVYFLFSSIFFGVLIQLACSFMGELFGWLTIVLLGVAMYLFALFGRKKKEEEKEKPVQDYVSDCYKPRRCCNKTSASASQSASALPTASATGSKC
jgi:hypothetical protein